MNKASQDTPLMQQHRAIKKKYPDAILLFRVGDFYETFENDALIASKVLGITLTKRNNGAAQSTDLAGFPHHALDTYLHKLVKAGYRVAICDQLEDPRQAKGLVKRGVTDLITPGLATHEKLLEFDHNNFLAALHITSDGMGIAFLDISTGEFFVAEGDKEYIDKLLQNFQPAEVIFSRQYSKQFKEWFGLSFYTYLLDSWIFEESYALENLLKQFQTHSLKGFGIEEWHKGIVAAGAILHYLKETEHGQLQHINRLQRIERDEYVWMDKFTIRNLELLSAATENDTSLLKVLNHTVSPMGARLLRRWLVMPLKNKQAIEERLDAVELLIKDTNLRKEVENLIKQCGDIERLAAKIPTKKIQPREVMQIAEALKCIAAIQLFAEKASNSYLQRLAHALNNCEYIEQQIRHTLADNLPATALKGNVIKAGVNEELDNLRHIAKGGKEYLIQLQQKEALQTGISTLKIGFNNVFGYYLEVTHAQKQKVPDSWIRKQTLTNAERYITPELKEYEETITHAEEKILALEWQLYDKLLIQLHDFITPLQTNAHILAILDCLICFSKIALLYNYKKPVIHEQLELDLKESRHPVIERTLPEGETYIANDIYLSPSQQQIIILTGPNMSGKSALLRQTALITILAHLGSFVPAQAASIPITDKIFTRVGASDNVSSGESTFMVEMNETASIINNISARSLVLLDEIGRGTSTYDGISIAWSIVEYLHASAAKPKTLFATHYHELNELENNLPGVKNFHISNKEAGNKIIFLRKLLPGGSTHSFGIQVAKMAGMPTELVERAKEVLKHLEDKFSSNNDASSEIKISSLQNRLKNISSPQIQLSIIDSYTEAFQTIRNLLEQIDINRLTPVEALLKLNEIKNLLK